MKIFGKQCKDYLSRVWPFMAATFALGLAELVLKKLELVNLERLNLFYLPGMILLIILGVVVQKAGFNKRQTVVASLLCLLSIIWLPPFLMPEPNMPFAYILINSIIMFLINGALYIILAMIGWLSSSLIGRRKKISEHISKAKRIKKGKKDR